MDTIWHDGLRTGNAKLAAAALALKRASAAAGPFSLAFLTDRRRIPDPEPVIRAMPAGSAVIYRDYDEPKRACAARRYRAICAPRGVLFLVAGDVDLALAVGADGAHWPGRLLAARTRFSEPVVPPGARGTITRLLTVSCHNALELAVAGAMGADLALLSPAFATTSHPGAAHLGPVRFLALAAASPLPVLALGGVDADNAARLAGKNVAGIAAIGAFQPSGFRVRISPTPPAHSRTDR